jgi:hypothetical protein
LAIGEKRATQIARSHPCITCGEFSFKKLTVKPASASHREELGEAWHVTRICGVCGAHQEIGIDAEGDVVYE